MGVQVEWLDNRQRIIVFTVSGKWKWDELFASIETCHRMIAEVDTTVRTIFDVSHMMGWPLNPLENMKRANKFYHPRSSTVAIVGVSRFLQSIVTLFQRLVGFSNPNGVHFFDRLPDAIEFLNSQLPMKSRIETESSA